MMSSKKASVVTGSSLLRLCNRCCSRHVANCVKGCNTSRAICTAAERWDFQANDSSAYQQSRPGFHQRNASGSYRNNHASSEQISYGYDQTAGGGYVNNNITQNVVQNNLAEHNGSVNGDFGQRNFKMQHKVGVVVDNSRGFGMHPNDSFERHNSTLDSGENMKYPNSHSLPRPIEYQGHRWNLTQNICRFQQATNFNTQNSAYGQSQQAPNLITQNSAYGQSQQAPNLNTQNSTYGQSQQKSMVGSPPNLNTAQKSMKELDSFCMEGKMKEAIAVFQSLEKLHIPDYLDRCLRLMQQCQKPKFLEEAKVVHKYALQHLSLLEVSTCNGILEKYFQEGKMKEAIAVLQLLEKLRIPVDLDRCLRLMQQCGKAKSLEEAKVVHKYALQHLSPLKVSTCNRILEMYIQCGSIDDAVNAFKNMTIHDLTTWYTMITQLAKNGFAEDSIDIFTQFKSLGLKPDGQMFIGVFGACSMLGDIVEGMLHFESMSRDYGVVPTMAHYVSLVDMIGSVGHLDEALEFIEKMPMKPSVEVWENLMNSCRVHGNTELGDRCAELVEKLDPSRLNEKSKVGLLLGETSYLIKNKLASNNLQEVRSQIHEYRAGDTSHPDTDEIYALLRGLRVQMKEAGYFAETKYVLHDIDHEGKEDALLGHSEKLAVAFGLLKSAARNPIRVIKNLRVCGDCHTALKIISGLVGRELIIRDAKRFHHFKNGICSCGDYW